MSISHEDSYDKWKTTVPEDYFAEKVCCSCCLCGKDFLEGDEYYKFDEGIFCEQCKDDYCDEHRMTAEVGCEDE